MPQRWRVFIHNTIKLAKKQGQMSTLALFSAIKESKWSKILAADPFVVSNGILTFYVFIIIMYIGIFQAKMVKVGMIMVEVIMVPCIHGFGSAIIIAAAVMKL